MSVQEEPPPPPGPDGDSPNFPVGGDSQMVVNGWRMPCFVNGMWRPDGCAGELQSLGNSFEIDFVYTPRWVLNGAGIIAIERQNADGPDSEDGTINVGSTYFDYLLIGGGLQYDGHTIESVIDVNSQACINSVYSYWFNYYKSANAQNSSLAMQGATAISHILAYSARFGLDEAQAAYAVATGIHETLGFTRLYEQNRSKIGETDLQFFNRVYNGVNGNVPGTDDGIIFGAKDILI